MIKMVIEKVTHKTTSAAATQTFVSNGFVKLRGARVSLPDIDIDYASNRRADIKQYLKGRWGYEQCLSVITYGQLKLRAGLTDVARSYSVPLARVKEVTKKLPEKGEFRDIFIAAQDDPAIMAFIQKYPRVIENLRSLMFQYRNAGIHASAFISAPKYSKGGERMEIWDWMPVKKNAEGELLSEWEGYDLEEVGYLKDDILSISELEKNKVVTDLIKEHYGTTIVLDNIPMDDQKTFDVFARGHTLDIFQFGSRGMKSMVQEIEPDSWADLAACNALYRPATLEIGAEQDYIRYKRKEAEPIYDWGTYETLKDTFSILLYQEQSAFLVQRVGGFDLVEADILRKAIGKKNIDFMNSLKSKFFLGAEKNNCPTDQAQKIWGKIESAASYQFNKSHATGYAKTAYDGAYLKANYPLPFYTNSLYYAKDDEVKLVMKELDEVGGMTVVAPDINFSQHNFIADYDTNEIFWGLSRVKGLAVAGMTKLMEARNEQEYRNVTDFVGRSGNNIAVARGLIFSGAFDKTYEVKQAVERYTLAMELYEAKGIKTDSDDFQKHFPEDMVLSNSWWTQKQIEICGYGTLRYKEMFLRANVKSEVKNTRYLSVADIEKPINEGKSCWLCGTLTDVMYKEGVGSSGKKWAFTKATISQNIDSISMTFWSDKSELWRETLEQNKGKIIALTGKIKYSDFKGGHELNAYAKTIVKILK